MPTTINPVRWGMLGASRIGGSALVPAIRRAEGRIVAVACRDSARGRVWADAHGVAEVCGYTELLARSDIDAIYIGLHNSAHLPWTLAALAAGKHVLCEKPLALNAAEVGQIIAAQRQHGGLVLEAFMYRFHPMIDRIRAICAAGELGEIRLMRGAFGFTLDNPGDPRWTPELGGGALYDVGCYPLNLMRLVSGREPELVAATADITGSGVDHISQLLLRFGSIRASLDCAFSLPFNQFFEIVGSKTVLRADRPFTQIGTEAVLRIGEREEHFGVVDSYALMVAHFQHALRGSEALRFPLEDALAQAIALDAILHVLRS